MTRILISVLLFLMASLGYAQKPTNLGIETLSKENNLPLGWSLLYGEYEFFADKKHQVEGSNSLSIKANPEGNNYAIVGFNFPNGYRGETLTVEGYVKTEDIERGYALFEVQLKEGAEVVAYDRIQETEITGTTKWQQYKLEVPLIQSDSIFINTYLVGQGQAWFDNFTVSIDGIDINDLDFKEKEPYKATLDHEFDHGSNFKLEEFNQQTVQNLAELGKAWGRLKYTNPRIAKGEYNWDYGLFRILPIVEDLEFDTKLAKWMQSYGEPQNTIPKVHYYLRFNSYVGNPVFKNENNYEDMNYSDDGYRLLALFRYWNMIEYFFPYKHLIKKDWNETLEAYTNKMLLANDQLSYELVLAELLADVQDSHAGMFQQKSAINNEKGRRIVPFKLKFVENKAVVERFYSVFPTTSSVQIGDELTSINGRSIQSYLEEHSKYISASNEAALLRDIVYVIMRTKEDHLDLSFSNDKRTFNERFETFPLDQIDFNPESKPAYKELESNIGYIDTGFLTEEETQDVMVSFMDKKGIVFDLRGYPNGNFHQGFGNFLLPNSTPFFLSKVHNKTDLYEFIENPFFEIGYENPDYYKGKIAILVDENSQSASEFLAMALQVAPQAKVFGSQTAGADGNVSQILLPGGIKTMMTGIGIYYPDGSETQQVGIRIDEVIHPTIQSVREGKDIVLERALEYLLEEN